MRRGVAAQPTGRGRNNIMETILRSEAKREIDTGKPFNLAFVTADRRRGTGGEYIEVKNWQKVKEDPAPEALPGKPALKPELTKKPDHWIHKTFNIFNPANPKQHPIKVHYRLMDVFNGKRIIQ